MAHHVELGRRRLVRHQSAKESRSRGRGSSLAAGSPRARARARAPVAGATPLPRAVAPGGRAPSPPGAARVDARRPELEVPLRAGVKTQRRGSAPVHHLAALQRGWGRAGARGRRCLLHDRCGHQLDRDQRRPPAAPRPAWRLPPRPAIGRRGSAGHVVRRRPT
jgi:hypothetical protein